MDFINQNFMTIVAALIGLVVLIVALVLWRTFSPSVRGRRGQRLGISEYHELDKMRRLVLVRRDNVEHLILIGGPQDVVIEAGIGIPGQASSVNRYCALSRFVHRTQNSTVVFESQRTSPADPPSTTRSCSRNRSGAWSGVHGSHATKRSVVGMKR